MSRMQISYEFFSQGLVADKTYLNSKGIVDFFPGSPVQPATYGLIAYHPASGQSPTTTNDDIIVYAGGLFDVEIILDRDSDIDSLADVEDRLMTLFHGKQFIATVSGVVESCKWTDTFDLPFDLVNGTYPRRIMRFDVIV